MKKGVGKKGREHCLVAAEQKRHDGCLTMCYSPSQKDEFVRSHGFGDCKPRNKKYWSQPASQPAEKEKEKKKAFRLGSGLTLTTIEKP